MNKPVEKFISCYQKLSTDNLATLKEIYHEDIHFQDPACELHGLNSLLDYFRHLYQDIESCNFVIQGKSSIDEQAFVSWEMSIKHRRIRDSISVEGISHLKLLDGKIVSHRDYFDLGALVYEHLPVLGKLVLRIRKRLTPKNDCHA
jgi:limonene-1,2-epoxide hydrolase